MRNAPFISAAKRIPRYPKGDFVSKLVQLGRRHNTSKSERTNRTALFAERLCDIRRHTHTDNRVIRTLAEIKKVLSSSRPLGDVPTSSFHNK